MPIVSACVSSVTLPMPIMIGASGQRASQGVIADDRIGEAEVDRIEDRIGEEAPAASLERGDGALERREVLRLARDQDRRRGHLVGDPQRVLAQAEEIVGARPARAHQLVGVEGVRADLEAERSQVDDRLLQVRKRRRRQAAEVDHVGAVGS